MIEEGVKNVYSSDNYKQYLSFLTKFHNYSFNNTMLILSQKPDASMVAGFYSWKENFHRYVNKGEKAIQILAPYQVDITKEVTKTDENGFILTEDKGQELTEEKKIKVTKFRMLQDDVTYMKYSCPSHLDFNVEKVIDDRIAISHYFELNGDLMADPDIELSLDTEHELLIPHTYQLDAFGIYQTEESHPKLGDELKTFIGTWLNNISDSGYRLSEIH